MLCFCGSLMRVLKGKVGTRARDGSVLASDYDETSKQEIGLEQMRSAVLSRVL